MLATPSTPQPDSSPPLLLRQADLAAEVGVTKAAVADATRRGRLRPAAYVPLGNAGRVVPVYSHDEAERWIARRRAA